MSNILEQEIIHDENREEAGEIESSIQTNSTYENRPLHQDISCQYFPPRSQPQMFQEPQIHKQQPYPSHLYYQESPMPHYTNHSPMMAFPSFQPQPITIPSHIQSINQTFQAISGRLEDSIWDLNNLLNLFFAIKV